VEKLIALLFAFAILGQVWVVRIHTKTWLSPACLYGLFWFAYTAIPLVAAPFAIINPLAIIYIFFTCLLFSVPVFALNWEGVVKLNQKMNPKFIYDSKFIKLSFYGLGSCAVIATIINWGIQGFSFYDILFNLIVTSGEYMSKRYSGDLHSNIASQISMVLTYPTAVLGGLLYRTKLNDDNGVRYIFLATISSVLMMIVEAAKGTLFLALVLFWSGSLLAKINNGEINNLVDSQFKARLLIWMPIIVCATTFSFIVRGIDTDNGLLETMEKLHYYFLSYSSGHLYAFADWFSSITTGGALLNYTSLEDSNGFYTFMSMFNLFGSSKSVPPGVFDDYYYLGEILKTNIYTHYRGLILDFGLVGSCVAMLLAGMLSNIMFYLLLRNKSPWIAASFFAHLLGYIYTSFIVSMLIWNSIFASFFVLALIFLVNGTFFRNQIFRN
jgi:oligosaccharide repeat unit polymerase